MNIKNTQMEQLVELIYILINLKIDYILLNNNII